MHAWLATLHGALKTEEAAQRAAHAEALRLGPAEQIAAGVRWPVLACVEEVLRRGERLVVGLIDGLVAGLVISLIVGLPDDFVMER